MRVPAPSAPTIGLALGVGVDVGVVDVGVGGCEGVATELSVRVGLGGGVGAETLDGVTSHPATRSATTQSASVREAWLLTRLCFPRKFLWTAMAPQCMTTLRLIDGQH